MKLLSAPRNSFLLGFASASLLALCSQAHAGYWEVIPNMRTGYTQSKMVWYSSSYEVQGTHTLHEVTGQNALRKNITVQGNGDLANLGIDWEMGSPSSYYTNVRSFPNSAPKTFTSTADYSMYAVLKWHRSSPQDNPPKKVYVYEHVYLGGYRWSRPDTTALVGYATLTGTIGVKGLRATMKQNPNPESSNWFGGDDAKINAYPVAGDTVTLPTVTYKGQVTLNPGYEQTTQGRQLMSAGYEVKVVNISVLARLKEKNSPENLEYKPYSSMASIAAGHLGDPENLHEADIALQFTTGNNEPLANVDVSDVPELEILKAAGVEKSATFQAVTPAAKTNGSGRLYMGALLSRDLTSSLDDTVQVKLKKTNGSSATIGESWGSVDWKMGQSGEKPWDSNFLIADHDYSEWAWTKIMFADKPLANHTMKFLVDYLEVKVTDPDTGEVITKIFTTDPATAQQYAGNSSYQVVYERDVTPSVLTYMTVPPSGITDAQGVVKGIFTVKTGDNFKVLSYGLALEDQGVYETKVVAN
ncbi:hypothetical protein EON83_25530 [bacterium]|nr:MAG: hypothetical protein EON83_25530 [bacterium]